MTTAPAHGERAHAWASPSSLDRILACPASAAFSAAMPPEVRDPNSAAAWGERAHEKADRLLRSWEGVEPGDEHAAVLVPYLAAVRDAFGGANGAALGRLLLVEERVDIAPPDCFGTFDAAVVDPFDRVVHVLDLKTGANGVPAEGNVQLGAYAVGLLRKYAGAKVGAWADWTVRLTTVGARRIDGGPVVDTWEAPGKWAADLSKRIVAAVKASRKPAPIPVAGDHCQWCKAAPRCPARLAVAASVFPVAEAENATGDAPGDLVGKPVEPALLDPAVLARVLAVEADIVAWLKSCRTYALTNPPPGWKVVAGRKGARAWIDEPTAAAAIKGAGLNPFEAPPVKSPTTVERELGKVAFAESFGELVHAPPGKPTLAPESDPRPAHAGSVFPSVEDGDA